MNTKETPSVETTTEGKQGVLETTEDTYSNSNSNSKFLMVFPHLQKKYNISLNAVIFIAPLIYWYRKNYKEVYKNSAGIETETMLSYRQQKVARKQLLSAGLIVEKNVWLDHKINFSLSKKFISENLDILSQQQRAKPKTKDKPVLPPFEVVDCFNNFNNEKPKLDPWGKPIEYGSNVTVYNTY